MTEITANVAIWHIRPEGIDLEPNEQAPQLLRLNLCDDVRIVLGRDTADTAEQAAAMRKLAWLATEAAEDMERQAAAQITEAEAQP